MNKLFCYDGEHKLDLKEYPTDCKINKEEKDHYIEKMQKNQEKMIALQDKLYAEGKEGIIIVLQALDAAGKDGTIKHVLGPLNPGGVDVIAFKQPNNEEQARDYLWRAHKAIPERGKIAVFNRSYYEDVLVVKVHSLEEHYKMATRCLHTGKEEFFKRRYKEIKHFEQYLYNNSYRVIKIFLHVSLEEQKKRFLARIDDSHRNWKFSSSDLKEREFYNDYMNAFKEAFTHTASTESPWYILPADQKWVTRYLVSEIVLHALEQCQPQYPDLAQSEKEALADCKAKLMEE